jgi:cell division inhibitor SepF
MSMWARTLVYLGLREEPEDAVDWRILEDAGPQDRPVDPPSGSGRGSSPAIAREASRGPSARPTAARSTGSDAPAPGASNVRPLRAGLDVAAERVAVVQVRVFEDVEAIGSRYRLRHPVLFDVSACTREVARRTVDFVAGLTYASHGTLRRTASRAFLLIPEGVDISLEERRRLAQLGYDVEGIAR